jgi:primosomal protein N' (replication factor Y) (superfamily II helicase)
VAESNEALKLDFNRKEQEKECTLKSYVNVIIPPLDKPLLYEIPAELSNSVTLGSRVEIPLGRRRCEGYVIERFQEEENIVNKKYSFEIKRISNLKILKKCFDAEHLAFYSWVTQYYGFSISTLIDAAVPKAAGVIKEQIITLVNKDHSDERGALQQKLGAAQKQVVELLLCQNNMLLPYASLKTSLKNPSIVIKTLVKKGIITVTRNEYIQSDPFQERFSKVGSHQEKASSVKLTPAQQNAVAEITSSIQDCIFHPFLLHGITGSGKTEVYIEAVRYALARGHSSLIIVPEIALTPQLIDRFYKQLNVPIAILHSGLKGKVRWASWQGILDGTYKIVIGARSALFAPNKNLGLVIVDEEHEHTYKQQDDPRYHARDMAVARAKIEQCPVVLGSATPSLESYFHALSKKYTMLSLPSRYTVNSGLKFECINMQEKKPWEKKSKNISNELYKLIHEKLQVKEQVFILYNKRGFSTYLQCEFCNEVLTCPHCSVTLTFHKSKKSLICHFCNYSITVPHSCPSCRAHGTETSIFAFRGSGTEKVFDELKEIFPEAAIDRLDRDIVENEDTYLTLFRNIREGKIDILVGTQMIAKGHDIPNVTLVGIIDCDTGIHFPDFRSEEKVFQLLTQASGRAGRAEKPGIVLLQTRNPHMPYIKYTLNQDFTSFAALELAKRKQLRYPPYVKLLRIIASSEDEHKPYEVLMNFKHALLKIAGTNRDEFQVLGPSSAPLAKIKSSWRWHLLIKSRTSTILNLLVKELKALQPKTKKLKIIFDKDPVDML